jgi:recombination protein RecA
MANMNKKAKETIVTVGMKDFDYKRIPFTSPRMNYCTFGGIPQGKIIEFYGEEHGGKTTSALDIVANFQQVDERKALYVDAENTLDVDWARKLGVDVDSLILLQPTSQSAEDIFQFIEEAVETGEIGLWVLDSIGVLVSAAEMDDKKTYEDKTYGGVSAPLTRFSKKIEMLMHRYNCTGIGINQEREDMNSTWGGTKTPGGKAWKHCCAARFCFRKGQFIDQDGKPLTRSAENPAGNIVLMSMTKNKTCMPTRRIGQYRINYLSGIDYLKDLVDVAIEFEIIEQKGAWFTIVDIETGEIVKDKIQGQAKVFSLLEEDTTLLERVEKMVDTALLEN